MKKFLIKVNGNQYEVEVEEIVERATDKASDGLQYKAYSDKDSAAAIKINNAYKDNQYKAQNDPQIAASDVTNITAPIPGTIIKVDVNTGEKVKKGQPLLVLEAMKMENEITSPLEGEIIAINVGQGKSVGAGEVLITIRKV